MVLALSQTGNGSSANHADVQGMFRNRGFKEVSGYTRDHCLSRYTSLITVSEIKHEAILLTINCYFVISEPEETKDKRVSLQLSDIAESTVRNMITGKQVQ